MMEIELLNAPFGAECRNVDLSGPFSADVRRKICEAWLQHSLLVFRDQDLDEQDYLRVGGLFGTVVREEYGIEVDATLAPGVGEISSLNPRYGGMGPMAFHSDYTYSSEPPSGLMLYGVAVPPPGAGGATVFTSTKLAYDAMPEELRRSIGELVVRHGIPDVQQLTERPTLLKDGPRADHPLVMRHPATGEKFLFLSPRHVDCVVGLPPEESNALIDELASYLGQLPNLYYHRWQPNDLVVWDNLALQHGREDFDASKHRRQLRRIVVA